MKQIFLIFFMILAGSALAADQKAREFQECPECPTMVGIPAGKFVMGSPANEPGRFDSEGPQRAVAVKAFALARTSVSSGEFLAFLRATGYRPKPCNAMLELSWKVPGRGGSWSCGA